MRAGCIIAGKYRLERLAGTGGMGVVWRASHVELGTPVAVKVLAAGVERNSEALRRFRGEARAAAALRCPNVVHVWDYGLEGGAPYLVMEYLEGESLAARLARLPGPKLSEVSLWATQAGLALDYAHVRGFLHRDIKPSNLFLCAATPTSVLKVLDFGIVKSLDEADGAHSTVVGSPGYLSPEQARGEGLDHTTDLWSLAAVLYRAVTGVEPFAAASLAETVERICVRPVAPPSTLVSGLPAELDGFFERALHRDRSARFRSGAELAAAFAVIADRTPGLVLPVATVEPTAIVQPRSDSTLSWESFSARERKRLAGVPKERRSKRSSARLAVVLAAGAALVAIGSRIERDEHESLPEARRVPTPQSVPRLPLDAPTPAVEVPVVPVTTARVAPVISKPSSPAPASERRRKLRTSAAGLSQQSAEAPPRPSSLPQPAKVARDPTFGLPFGGGEADGSPHAASRRGFDVPH